MPLPLSALFDLPEGEPVEVEHVATGTLWFVSEVNPYRVRLGLFYGYDSVSVVDLDPHTVEVEEVDGRHVVRHLDNEEPTR